MSELNFTERTTTGSRLPPVRALVKERIIFTYRLPPEHLKKLLPVPWLMPQLVDGSAIASVCVLRLSNIVPGQVPTFLGARSISTARRYGVLDQRNEGSPAVFVTERTTSSVLGSFLTAVGFSARHQHLPTRIRRDGHSSLITLGKEKFRARVTPAQHWSSSLFPTIQTFSTFLAEGVRSYGTSRHAGRLTVLDLAKEDNGYVPLTAYEVGGSSVQPWLEAGAVLDNAARTVNSMYRWTYHGLTAKM